MSLVLIIVRELLESLIFISDNDVSGFENVQTDLFDVCFASFASFKSLSGSGTSSVLSLDDVLFGELPQPVKKKIISVVMTIRSIMSLKPCSQRPGLSAVLVFCATSAGASAQ